MGKSRTGLAATVLALTGGFFILLAFVTPNWLVSDGKLEKPKFTNMGLWMICMSGYEDPRHFHDVKFYGCWFLFEEEYYIIDEFLFPSFFIATEFFFMVCFVLAFIANLLVTTYMCCSRHHDKYIFLLRITGGNLLASAFAGTIALILFGLYGDGRDWMPNWEHNNIGWSYAVAVIGIIETYLAGFLFTIESRVHSIKRRKRQQAHSDYDLQMQKPSEHSDV
ncbi:unnamed protein product [Bemisia tabaci]|uniref:Uncharacterized protein n=1 Tax=Bemisia tabaci TaxID=7038 RepID=A0A9P0FA01_BEMTA|nr:PREDICTED: uncharacterized protein LOC109043927 [Bemisia tabaci]CAH0396146.1 unnamed protein product [Bemisia tabaci]